MRVPGLAQLPDKLDPTTLVEDNNEENLVEFVRSKKSTTKLLFNLKINRYYEIISWWDNKTKSCILKNTHIEFFSNENNQYGDFLITILLERKTKRKGRKHSCFLMVVFVIRTRFMDAHLQPVSVVYLLRQVMHVMLKLNGV